MFTVYIPLWTGLDVGLNGVRNEVDGIVNLVDGFGFGSVAAVGRPYGTQNTPRYIRPVF